MKDGKKGSTRDTDDEDALSRVAEVEAGLGVHEYFNIRRRAEGTYTLTARILLAPLVGVTPDQRLSQRRRCGLEGESSAVLGGLVCGEVTVGGEGALAHAAQCAFLTILLEAVREKERNHLPC